MQDTFGRLAWVRVLRGFRRGRPTMPIRRRPDRKPPGLELIRLDDRIAPGSVWTNAAAQAVALGGPLAWLGLGETDLAAVGAVMPLPASASSPAATADGHPGDRPVALQPRLF